MSRYSVRIGELRTQITFQEPTVSKDPGGAQSATWANVASNPTVWARWTYDHGQEQVASEAEVAVQRATVTVRYRADVVSTWRVLLDGNAWRILSVDQVQERNRWTEMRVERAKATVV